MTTHYAQQVYRVSKTDILNEYKKLFTTSEQTKENRADLRVLELVELEEKYYIVFLPEAMLVDLGHIIGSFCVNDLYVLFVSLATFNYGTHNEPFRFILCELWEPEKEH